ncbi:uncharacterized protein (TIGR00369 family) [Constrictibacter sp. MBR-5]|jgi:uncharacterized protein (TIGR00369 family)|uniref:PaaI family thioesterase n=1 Tax=Constrictibacter sp. MBR-5 TaxID=3156467 RepID=UPI00339AD297
MTEDRAGTPDVPEGFVPQGRSSPFLAPFEPIWEKPFAADTPHGPVRGVMVAVRLDTPHLNSKGLAHGALLTALADIAMGRSLALASDPPQRCVTVSLSIDYHAPARAGDWLEARVDHLRAGRKLGFASCFLMVGDKVVARANGTFSPVGG